MKKLLYIANLRLPTEKAHGLQIAKSCEAFARAGLDVTLLTVKRKNPIQEDVFSYYGIEPVFKTHEVPGIDLTGISFIPEKLAFYIGMVTSGISGLLYAAFRTDTKNTLYYSREYIALFFLCLVGLRPIAEIHDYRSQHYKWWHAIIFKRARKIIVNSEGTRDSILRLYKLPAKNILIAPNGVDVGFFDIPLTRGQAREQLSIKSDGPVLAYIGRLQTVGMEKGVSDLLRAFALLVDRADRPLLYVIGGPDELVVKYRKEAKELGISDERVVFTGHIAYKDVPTYLRAIDIVVTPFPDTRQLALTASPIKIFEFMAAGKTIAVSDLPSLRRYLDETCAVFFKAGDYSSLREVLERILDDSVQAERLAVQAQRRADSHTWQQRARDILVFISS